MGLPEHASTPSATPPAVIRRRASMTAIQEPPSMEMPRAFKNQRSVSCPVRSIAGVTTGERFVLTPSGIAFESEVFRLRNEARITLLLETATSPVGSSTNALLARKALKYRRVHVPVATNGAHRFERAKTNNVNHYEQREPRRTTRLIDADSPSVLCIIRRGAEKTMPCGSPWGAMLKQRSDGKKKKKILPRHGGGTNDAESATKPAREHLSRDGDVGVVDERYRHAHGDGRQGLVAQTTGGGGLRKLGLILVIVGALLTVIAVVYGSALHLLVDSKVKDGVVVCDDSGAGEESYYDAYGDCDDCNPYYYTLHMFNASNAEAYLAGEASKLQLVETGPYVFRRREFKIDINFLDGGARVSYKSYTYHTFEGSLSCDGCSDSDKFTSFDVAYLNVIAQAGGERSFLMKLAAGSFSTNESVIADTIENYGPQMMRWVNGLNSLDPVAMNNVASGGTVVSFLATGPEAIADLDLSGFVYNGLFVTRTVSQWALGYPSLLAGLGLGSEYVTSCDAANGWNAKCSSCEGDACLDIWYECKQCALGASVVAINNVTCGIIEDMYAEEYGAEEAATFRENTCDLCEAFGLCAAPLPDIAEDSGLDYSKAPPSADDLETYSQTTGCADDTEILDYKEFNGYTATALWVTTLGEDRRNPTLLEIIAFNDYGNCANPTSNLTCSAVQGNDATIIKPGGAGMTGFGDTLAQTSSDMYLDEGKQNVTLYSTGMEVDHEGITLHRFSPLDDLLANSEHNNAKGTGWPVDGVQPLAFTAGFLAYVSYPLYIYGNTSLLDAVEITMIDGVVAAGSSMYNSDSGDLKQEYIDKYVTYIDVEAGTGKTMVAHKRLMASYVVLGSERVGADVRRAVAQPRGGGHFPRVLGRGERHSRQLVRGLLPPHPAPAAVDSARADRRDHRRLALVGGGFFHRRRTARQQRKDPAGDV
ncbi:hypothetical protein PHYPSEUDO_002797 [Phytophthora pseudosyringae]|uniref:Uncharacterized protein n=1 Tax=Phytophthora pseudosyringae TaxID=221518 RepID=A0A8T1VVL3_9STRA|nr:hypothetical protein PHYPSEUDO_002797 [Phytophthora pseudosyringae]